MWWRRRPERDFRAEIDAHLALEAEDLARQQGLPSDEARYAARRAFGNVTAAEERFYESRRLLWLERLTQHLTYAGRTLLREPGFSIAAITTLAIGIGLNTAIFTFFYSFVLRSLPVRDADQVVNVYQVLRGRVSRNVRGMTSRISYPEYLTYAARSRTLSSAAVYHDIELSSPNAPSGIARGQLVSCNYFSSLAVRTALGRPFTNDECSHSGAGPVVVLSHRTWSTQFGGDSAVVGQAITINNLPLLVVGVTEPRFAGIMPQAAELWIPVTMQPALAHGRDSVLTHSNASWLTMVGRLAPGATAEQARAELAVVARELDRSYPGRETRVVVTPGALINFPEARSEAGPVIGFLGLLSAMIVAMACANVMNCSLRVAWHDDGRSPSGWRSVRREGAWSSSSSSRADS